MSLSSTTSTPGSPEAGEQSSSHDFHAQATIAETGYIEADTGDDDGGYLSESQEGSSTTSLTDTIFHYQYENGRRYHGYREGEYLLPNDETEQDRLDIMHHTYLLMLGGQLHIVPFQENPQRILDVGTGTGIWAIDMADQYPSAVVTGTDLSPIQPRWVPTNCTFQIDDAEATWTWPTDYFDLIHSRGLCMSISNWPRYLDQLLAHTKPGGWIQLVEHDLAPTCDDETYLQTSPTRQYVNTLLSSLSAAGKEVRLAEKLKDAVTAAGFVNVQEVKMKLPSSPWPKDPKMKELGKWMLLITESGLEAYALAAMSRAEDKKTKDEIMALVDGVKQDQRSKKVHLYQYHRYVIGQKPYPAERHQHH